MFGVKAVPGDVVDHQRSGRAAVVRTRHGPEALLSGRVPDLQLDFLAAHLDYPRAELDADGVGAVGHDCVAERERGGIGLCFALTDDMLTATARYTQFTS